MNIKKTLISMAAAFSLMLGLSACGDNTEQLNKAAKLVSDHYRQNPPSRNWRVLSVKAIIPDDKVMVQVLVTEEKDVNRIKTLSRMDQLHVAKLACPLMFAELRTQLGSDTRIWVELKANNKVLVTSICAR
ncbi:MAG: hypothetical protein COB59_07050 [Rhodospirillaceae bacterium]|nr:MAG: hypothetical protein COB59_07050 [Rhodospirillaceae bacterium]